MANAIRQEINPLSNLHVWLAYVAYPVTTAAYFERALRKRCRTTTIGPPMPIELIEKWQLQNMKLPLKEQDISTCPQPDMVEIIAATAPDNLPNLYLWVESVAGHRPLHIEALPCPKVCYFIDSHLNLPMHLEWAKHFDMVFIAQREYLDEFRRQGTQVYWLPLGCDPEIHCRTEEQKSFNIGFVGSVEPGSQREKLLAELSNRIPVHYERCFWDEMVRLFSRSRIVFNNAVRNDLNMRIFEVMSTGTLLLTDIARNSGQDELFRDGEDYAIYQDSNIFDIAQFYLDRRELSEKIALRGQHLVHNAHTYAHRMEDLIAVALEGKPDTFSATELRERSLVDVPAIDYNIPTCGTSRSTNRSFVIPVLDMSPASEYNIRTLLKDLEHIEGDVIVIFNGLEVAEQLKGHPRITRYAIMKQNIGVARAWNVGLEMAKTPIVFILNADLHVEQEAIDTLGNYLYSLPNAACVGPQGSFFDFSLTRDYKYFDKGGFRSPLEVDAISGFFFALKLQYFNEKIIRFENDFTPCYFEEWDLGLQIKQAGLKSYIVPTTAYDHHWSGSIRALSEIRYYEKAETAEEILSRNRKLFLNKWRGIAGRTNDQKLLESGFSAYVIGHVRALVADGLLSKAQKWLDAVILSCQGNTELPVLRQLQHILSQTASTVRSAPVNTTPTAPPMSSFQNLFNMVPPVRTPEDLCKDDTGLTNVGNSNKIDFTSGNNN